MRKPVSAVRNGPTWGGDRPPDANKFTHGEKLAAAAESDVNTSSLTSPQTAETQAACAR